MIKKISLFILIIFIILMGSTSVIKPLDAKNIKSQNMGKKVYSVKTPSGIYFSINNNDYLVGGTEVRIPSNASVYIFDIKKEEIVMEHKIPNSSAIWAFCDTPDYIFFSTIDGLGNFGSSLFRISKSTYKIEKLHDFDETMVYAMAYDSKDKIYIGTSHKANLYQYNIKSSKMLKLNSEKITNQDIIRSIEFNDGICYLGIGTNADLVLFDVEYKKVLSVLPNIYKKESFVYDIKALDKKIVFLLSPSMKMMVYDPILNCVNDLQIEKLTENDNFIDKTLYNFAGIQIMSSNKKNTYKYFFNRDMIVSKIINNKIVGISPSGIYKIFNNQNIQENQIDLALKLNKTWEEPIEFVVENGYLYFPGRRFLVYNKNTLLGSGIVNSEPQASALSSNGIYTANYTDATIWFYPKKLLKNLGFSGENLSQKKFLISDIDKNQLRPYMMAVSKNENYLATVSGPQYGQYGGALTVYDIKNGQKKYTNRNIVNNHGLISLDMDDIDENIIWLGSYIWGERTLKPIEDDAKLIKYDLSKEKVIFKVTPLKGAPSIRTIIKFNDNVYCLINNDLYKIDAYNGKVISKLDNIKLNEICRVGKLIIGITNSEIVFIDSEKMDVTKKYSGYSLLNNLRYDRKLNEIYVFDGNNLIRFY